MTDSPLIAYMLLGIGTISIAHILSTSIRSITAAYIYLLDKRLLPYTAFIIEILIFTINPPAATGTGNDKKLSNLAKIYTNTKI